MSVLNALYWQVPGALSLVGTIAYCTCVIHRSSHMPDNVTLNELQQVKGKECFRQQQSGWQPTQHSRLVTTISVAIVTAVQFSSS
jgi:hypothetical protein